MACATKRHTTMEVHQAAAFLRRWIQISLFKPQVWNMDQKPWFMWNQRATKPMM